MVINRVVIKDGNILFLRLVVLVGAISKSITFALAIMKLRAGLSHLFFFGHFRVFEFTVSMSERTLCQLKLRILVILPF